MLDAYTWCVITADAPEWYVCPIYKTALGEQEKFDKICSDTPLTLAPCLLDVLRSSDPPSDFFLSLPAPPLVDKVWAIYILLLEKLGCPSQLYLGSGTNAGYGVQARIIPAARLRFVALEATLAYIFHAGFETRLDAIWTVHLPWKRETVTWLPLYSHTALTERPVGYHTMTEDELGEYNAKRQERVKEQMAVSCKRYRGKTRAYDLKGYLARTLKTRLEWQLRNPARVLEIATGVRDRAMASKKHHCDICNRSLQSKTALDKHLDTKQHAEQVRLAAGGEPKPVSAEAMRSRNFSATSRTLKRYRCDTCDKNFGIKGHLDKHYTTKGHQKKVTAASAEHP